MKPVLCHNFYMWGLIYYFVEHSLRYKLVKTRSHYYFSIQSYGILKTVKTSNLKAHNDEKKKKNNISTPFKRTLKIAKTT